MHAKVENNIPTEFTLRQLKAENPSVSFPKTIPAEILAAFSVYEVVDNPPTLANSEEIKSTELVFDGVAVTKSYTVGEISNEQKRLMAKSELNQNLESLTYTFADGRVIQTRPSDLSNFQVVIELGQDEEWILEDNSLSVLTTLELKEAMDSGIAQAKVLWDNYKNFIRSLV